jgi:hypothetical protein
VATERRVAGRNQDTPVILERLHHLLGRFPPPCNPPCTNVGQNGGQLSTCGLTGVLENDLMFFQF